MLSLKNYFFGSVVFYAAILLTYNRRKTTLSSDEDKQWREWRGRVKDAGNSKQAIRDYRSLRMRDAQGGVKVDKEFEQKYMEREWVR